MRTVFEHGLFDPKGSGKFQNAGFCLSLERDNGHNSLIRGDERMSHLEIRRRRGEPRGALSLLSNHRTSATRFIW